MKLSDQCLVLCVIGTALLATCTTGVSGARMRYSKGIEECKFTPKHQTSPAIMYKTSDCRLKGNRQSCTNTYVHCNSTHVDHISRRCRLCMMKCLLKTKGNIKACGITCIVTKKCKLCGIGCKPVYDNRDPLIGVTKPTTSMDATHSDKTPSGTAGMTSFRTSGITSPGISWTTSPGTSWTTFPGTSGNTFPGTSEGTSSEETFTPPGLLPETSQLTNETTPSHGYSTLTSDTKTVTSPDQSTWTPTGEIGTTTESAGKTDSLGGNSTTPCPDCRDRYYSDKHMTMLLASFVAVVTMCLIAAVYSYKLKIKAIICRRREPMPLDRDHSFYNPNYTRSARSFPARCRAWYPAYSTEQLHTVSPRKSLDGLFDNNTHAHVADPQVNGADPQADVADPQPDVADVNGVNP